MGVTIKDVAELAGVHASTVSRVFAGHAAISAATRERVMAAAEQLNFHPNAIAGALRTQRASTLGMVIPYTYDEFFSDPFFPEVVRGLSTVICPLGYRLVLAGVDTPAREPEEVMRLVRTHLVDGIIVQASRINVDTTSRLLTEGHPFVLLGRPMVDHPDINWVEIDSLNATREAVEHLITLGHQRIAFIGGQPDLVVTLDRLEGYRTALTAAGLPIDPALVDHGAFLLEGGQEAMQRMLALPRGRRPTAVFAANDLMAVGALLALQSAGLKVPRDVSLVGSLDSPLASLVTPQLTSSRADYQLLAKHAASALVAHIEHPDTTTPVKEWIPSHLVMRESTAAPRQH